MHWISFHGNRYQWKKQCWRKYPAGGHSNNEQMSIPQRRRLHVGVWSQRPGGKGQEPALCEGLVEVNHWLFLVPAKSVRVALEFYERQQCKGWAVLQRMQFRWGWSRYRKEWQHVAGKSPEVEHSFLSRLVFLIESFLSCFVYDFSLTIGLWQIFSWTNRWQIFSRMFCLWRIFERSYNCWTRYPLFPAALSPDLEWKQFSWPFNFIRSSLFLF